MATWWRRSSSRATRSPPSSGCTQGERRDAQMTETTREPAAPSGPGDRDLDFEVEGMTCGSCAVRIERVLGRQPGVASAQVNFATGEARVASEGPVEVGGLQA